MATKKTEGGDQAQTQQPNTAAAEKPAAEKTTTKQSTKKAPKKNSTKAPTAAAEKKSPAKKSKLQKQVGEILKEAEKKGIKNNFFFSTTLNRYITQLNIMTKLEQDINEHGELVTKEYVKGRGNLYVNPAVSEYNKTSTAANGTVATLMKILTTLSNENPEGASKLASMLEALNDD